MLFLTRTKNYLRLYLQKSYPGNSGGRGEEMGKAVLETVLRVGSSVKDTHGDFSVLLHYWETLFFSGRFDDEQRAEEFLKNNPAAPRHIDFDSLITKADRCGFKWLHILMAC